MGIVSAARIVSGQEAGVVENASATVGVSPLKLQGHVLGTNANVYRA